MNWFEPMQIVSTSVLNRNRNLNPPGPEKKIKIKIKKGER
jgi:hypothetical protein